MSEWVKCSERMPYRHAEYLIFVKCTTWRWEKTEVSADEIVSKRRKTITRNIEVAEGNSEGWSLNQNENVKVTHWMPLPTPPELDYDE